jgi:hypothetical protein
MAEQVTFRTCRTLYPPFRTCRTLYPRARERPACPDSTAATTYSNSVANASSSTTTAELTTEDMKAVIAVAAYEVRWYGGPSATWATPTGHAGRCTRESKSAKGCLSGWPRESAATV